MVLVGGGALVGVGQGHDGLDHKGAHLFHTHFLGPKVHPHRGELLGVPHGEGHGGGGLVHDAAVFGGPDSRLLVDSSRTEAQYGIKCADLDKYSSLSDWEVIQDARHEQSYWADASDIVVSCARWRFDAKERYEGNFTVKTRNPIMLIGNTADPVTPIVGARNASAGYEGSVVLQHDSYGVSIDIMVVLVFDQSELTWY